MVRYNEECDRLDYLFDVDEVTGDLRNSGRATQCKIHYSFVPEAATGLLYAATHLSGPPVGETHYNPWASWHDDGRAFRGSYLITYDTTSDAVVSSTLMIPQEGCRCLALDDMRRRLYAVTYPRDHFVSYDLTTGLLKDYGRIGSVNSQCLFLDRLGRVFLFADSGRLLRFDPERDLLEELPVIFPHAAYQSAWHGVLYDVVTDHTTGGFFMVPWKAHPRLARYWPEAGPNGRIEDLGVLTQDREEREIMSVNLDHVGGLVSDRDGGLYFTRAVWGSGRTSKLRGRTLAELCRRNPDGEIQALGSLQSETGGNHYVSRAAVSSGGTMILGKILTSPAGVYRVRIPALARALEQREFLRNWG